MKRVRFDLDLTDEEMTILGRMEKRFYRTRKNMCEAIIKLTLRRFNDDSPMVFINNLGVINDEDDEKHSETISDEKGGHQVPKKEL